MAYDVNEGTNFLPHVYCEKVILETGRQKVEKAGDEAIKKENQSIDTTSSNDNLTVTLKLQLLANVSTINNWLSTDASAFLNDVNLFDGLFVQVVPVFGSQIRSLKASYLPANLGDKEPTNIYVAGRQLNNEDWLPYGAVGDSKASAGDWSNIVLSTLAVEGKIPKPIKVSTATIFGEGQAASLNDTLLQGKIREKNIDGQVYYVIPMTYSFVFSSQVQNLGFMFYSLIHTPYIADNFSTTGQSITGDAARIRFGSINGEIVLENGVAPETREAFTTPTGKYWEGSVHHHATGINPDQNNYQGDGSFGPNKGWMAGQRHIPGAQQPKLQLNQVANYKIDDFRTGKGPKIIDNVLGILPVTENSSVLAIKKINNLIGDFQKETKKDFERKNDDEYSKLYLSRDASGAARGLFFINIYNFLRNNSELFSSLQGPQGMMTSSLNEIIENCKILELKVYRDRVEEKSISGRKQKIFKNDTFYEQSSSLIGVLSDIETFGDPTQTKQLHEMSLSDVFDGHRYFVFEDKGTIGLTSGTYQYRVEIKFKNGTYEFMNRYIQRLELIRSKLQQYYQLSLSGIPIDQDNKVFRNSVISNTYKGQRFKQYFDDQYGTFVPEFADTILEEEFSESKFRLVGDSFYVFDSAIFELSKTGQFFDFIKDYNDIGNVLLSMVSPIYGSPQGISHVIKIYDALIGRLEAITRIKKYKNGGSDLTSKTNTVTNYQGGSSSPIFNIIDDSHEFDDPSSLYKVTQNNEVFVDYLEVHRSRLQTVIQGLRSVTPEYFKQRCQLDAAKFSTFANNSEGFTNVDIARLVPDQAFYSNADNFKLAVKNNFAGPTIKTVSVSKDTLDKTAYSFLSPSIVFYRNRSNNKLMFFDSFKPNANERLNTLAGNLLGASLQGADYDFLLSHLVSFSLENKENNATPTDTNFHPFSESLGSMSALLGKLNITAHSVSNFDDFYDKEPGAVNGALDGVLNSFRDIFPLKVQDYSDGPLNIDSLKLKLSEFLARTNIQGINLPAANLLGGVSNYFTQKLQIPNNFKLYDYYTNRKAYGIPTDDLNPVFRKAFEGIKQNNSMLFFNFNMTARVEVFMPNNALNAKDDDNMWRLLTEQDLNLNGSKKLFCRLKYFNESLLGNIEIPTLNKHFLIYSGANQSVPAVTNTIAAGSVPSSIKKAAAGFLNQKNIKEMGTRVSETPSNPVRTPSRTPRPLDRARGSVTPARSSGRSSRPATGRAAAPSPSRSTPARSTPSTAPRNTTPRTGGTGGGGGGY